MAKRKIIRIDEDLCDGCGLCIPSCAEGALQIIDGKARLVSDKHCDGLGACLGECPKGALTIEEREADGFQEPPSHAPEHHQIHLSGGCPSARVQHLRSREPPSRRVNTTRESALSHWPVKLRLVPPTAPFLEGAHLVLAADCVPFSLADFHDSILPGRVVVIGCPKFDDPDLALERLTAILSTADVTDLTVVHMEVPCCFGYRQLAAQALLSSGKQIPLHEVIVGMHGEIQNDTASGSGT